MDNCRIINFSNRICLYCIADIRRNVRYSDTQRTGCYDIVRRHSRNRRRRLRIDPVRTFHSRRNGRPTYSPRTFPDPSRLDHLNSLNSSCILCKCLVFCRKCRHWNNRRCLRIRHISLCGILHHNPHQLQRFLAQVNALPMPRKLFFFQKRRMFPWRDFCFCISC